MVNMGRPEVELKDDGWTAVTRDGSLSAHFEHSVAITATGPYILSLP
jgi:methionyl aminopeptidase